MGTSTSKEASGNERNFISLEQLKQLHGRTVAEAEAMVKIWNIHLSFTLNLVEYDENKEKFYYYNGEMSYRNAVCVLVDSNGVIIHSRNG
jgi:hypothetical protein